VPAGRLSATGIDNVVLHLGQMDLADWIAEKTLTRP
jgi:hypothetical protein